MTDDQEIPAKTIELDGDVIDTALMTRDTQRHPHLDGYADMYQTALSVLALADQYDEAFDDADLAESVSHFASTARSVADAIIVHVRENHEHAVRWSVDVYDEIERDE